MNKAIIYGILMIIISIYEFSKCVYYKCAGTLSSATIKSIDYKVGRRLRNLVTTRLKCHSSNLNLEDFQSSYLMPSYEIGDIVEIYYLKSNPSKFIFKKAILKLLLKGAFFGCFGIVSILSSV